MKKKEATGVWYSSTTQHNVTSNTIAHHCKKRITTLIHTKRSRFIVATKYNKPQRYNSTPWHVQLCFIVAGQQSQECRCTPNEFMLSRSLPISWREHGNGNNTLTSRKQVVTKHPFTVTTTRQRKCAKVGMGRWVGWWSTQLRMLRPEGC